VARYLRLDQSRTRALIDAYRTTLPDASPSDVLVAISTDYMYRRNTTHVAELQAAQAKASVYAYVFNWKTPVLGGVLRSPHTLEVPFAFGTTEAASALVGSGPQIEALTRETMGRWVSFARTGVPGLPGQVAWPRYDTVTRSTMMLDLESHITGNPGGEARKAMDDLPFYEYSRPASFVHA
jgi:para-nitrobenzyl esterase